MSLLLGWALVLVYGLSLFCLFLYGINSYLMILLHRRRRAGALAADEAVWAAWHPDPAALPPVTVQLPIFNERYVLSRLLEAVTRLDYPPDKLEIQILDDSTDDTTARAAALAQRYRARGFQIVHLHRQVRDGYKAGALRDALPVARGEFLAVFDADFVPPPDFLRRTLPFFADPKVGMVQARWGHINRDYSNLTRAQALGIDGHFGVEQASRAWLGLFLNFNGTAGIWRRTTILDAGGWQADTLTEDLDLSYRAQLRGWVLKYLPQVVCPAEIPVTITGFKSQQHRWAKGSIQTARKLIPRILRAPIPAFTKYQAALHLTHYAVHPLMLLVAVLSPILLRFHIFFQGWRDLFSAAVFFALATFGPSALYLYAQRVLSPDWRRRIRHLPFLMFLGTGIALSNTRAVLEGLCSRGGAFVRTPKYRIEGRRDQWQARRYRLPFPWLSALEIPLFLYSLYGLLLFVQQTKYLMGPFLLLYTLGFGYVAILSLWHARLETLTPRRRVLRRLAVRHRTLLAWAVAPVLGRRPQADRRGPGGMDPRRPVGSS